MEKIKDLVRKKSGRSLHRKSRSIDHQSSPRPSTDLSSTHPFDSAHPESNKDLPPVPAVNHTSTTSPTSASASVPAASHDGPAASLRPSSQWGTSLQDQQQQQQQQHHQQHYDQQYNQQYDQQYIHQQHHQQQQQQPATPVAPASAIPDRESSRRFKRASPPHIEQDYDQYRNMLATSAAGSHGADADVFHDANEDFRDPASPTAANRHAQMSRKYGGHQSHGMNGNDLDMQGLSVADDDNQPVSTQRGALDSLAHKHNATTRKALPPRPQDNPSSSISQDPDRAPSHAQPPYLPQLDRHPPSSITAPTTNDPNHTFTSLPHSDPLARFPASFKHQDTVDTKVSTTVAPAVVHETRHTKRIEIVQEAITRDIHVHHYYHYVQPVKVVEVNPARHFRLNAKGEKLSIAAPEGWQMPSDLAVRRAPELDGTLGWSRRDYIVNEQSPQGRLLTADELEQERADGHLVSPAGVGARRNNNMNNAAARQDGRGMATTENGVSNPVVRDSEMGIAR